MAGSIATVVQWICACGACLRERRPGAGWTDERRPHLSPRAGSPAHATPRSPWRSSSAAFVNAPEGQVRNYSNSRVRRAANSEFNSSASLGCGPSATFCGSDSLGDRRRHVDAPAKLATLTYTKVSPTPSSNRFGFARVVSCARGDRHEVAQVNGPTRCSPKGVIVFDAMVIPALSCNSMVRSERTFP